MSEWINVKDQQAIEEIRRLQIEIDTLKDEIYDNNVYIAELEHAGLEYLAEIRQLKEQIKQMKDAAQAKEIVMKVETHGDGFGCLNYCCPACGCVLWNSDNPGRPDFEKRCPRCFQRLVWR